MIQGEIHTFPLFDLVQWLAQDRRTGKLVIAQGADSVQLYPAEGALAVNQPIPTAGPRLTAEFYFAEGYITAATIGGRSTTNSPEQIRTVLSTALNWRSGRFAFSAFPAAFGATLNSIRLSAETLLQEIAAGPEPGQQPGAAPDSNEADKAERTAGSFRLAALRVQVADKMLREDFIVPAMPQLAVRVIELTRDENFSPRDLSNLIHADQAVAARVLRYANSALHGRGREVISLTQAVQRLGSDEVFNIVLAASLQARRLGRDLFATEKRRLWSHSSVAAFFARSLATRVGLDQSLGFLCGLLMDFGMAALYSLIQDVLGRRTGAGQIPTRHIEEIVQDYHPHAGRTVGEKWRLPQTVIEVMAYHHCVEESGSNDPYVALAALADFLATFALNLPRTARAASLASLSPEQLAAQPAARLIGLSEDRAAAVLRDLPQNLEHALEFVTN